MTPMGTTRQASFTISFVVKMLYISVERWGHGLVKGDVPLLILETLKVECHLIDKFKFMIYGFFWGRNN